MPLERLQKILSARGIASRRKAEEYIEKGHVKINGRVATLGEKADPVKDTIEVDGKVLSDRQEMLYYVMNKPVGVLTSNVDTGTRGIRGKSSESLESSESLSGSQKSPSPTERQEVTVRDLLPSEIKGKIFPVGRLDKDSSGLLLFTNDGVLAYRLTHPKFDHDKEYEVTVDRPIPNMVLKHLAQGIMLKGKKTKEAKVSKISSRTFSITLTEGRNRQIRRMCQQEGFTVKELKRVRIMTLRDTTLKHGALRKLSQREVSDLLKSVSLVLSR